MPNEYDAIKVKGSPMTKTCKRCQEELPLDDFDTKTSAADGKYPYCKDCRRAMRGNTKRQPPKLAEVDCSIVQTLEEQCKDQEYAQIVAEAIEYAKHPAMQKIRKVRNNARILTEKPVLDFEKECWSEQDEAIADMLYEAWEKRQKQDEDRFNQIKEQFPIATKKNTKNYEMRQGYSFDEWSRYQEGNFEEESE